MKRFSEQLKKKSLTIRMTAAEKNDVRERLVSYMEYHPLPTQGKKIAKATTETAPYRFISIPTKFLRLGMGVSAVFVLVVLPTLAEQTVPGDILYPVKVRVTEEIRSSLNLSGYEKVAWETERLERRVAEARLLAKEGRLTPEVEADVLAAVQAHTSAAEGEIASLMVTDAEGASLAQMTFATRLDVQSALLRSGQGSASASSVTMAPTSALASALEQGQVVALGKGDNSPVSFERLMAQLELETTRVHELLDTVSKTATAQERTDVKRRLGDIEQKINDAAVVHAQQPEVAITSLRAAWRDTQKIISFMTDIDVRSSVTVESLVPVVLSYEERTVKLGQERDVLLNDVTRITYGLPEVTDADVREKITATLPEIERLIDGASTTNHETITAAEADIRTAAELITSILSLADFSAVPEEVPEIPDDETATSTEDEITDGAATSTASTTTSLEE